MTNKIAILDSDPNPEASKSYNRGREHVAVWANGQQLRMCEPTPITDSMDRLMEAYRLGEFSDEGGSDTVGVLSVASFDAAESHGHDADSYMAGYCAALYEQAKPFIWLALKPKQQGEPVAICRLWNEGGSGERTSVEFVGEPCADGALLYAEQPAPLAVVMPERKHAHPSNPLYAEFMQYNAALDDVSKLNGLKPD